MNITKFEEKDDVRFNLGISISYDDFTVIYRRILWHWNHLLNCFLNLEKMWFSC